MSNNINKNKNFRNNNFSKDTKLKYGYARKNNSEVSSFINNNNYGLYGIIYNDILEYFDTYGIPECKESRLKYILNQKLGKIKENTKNIHKFSNKNINNLFDQSQPLTKQSYKNVENKLKKKLEKRKLEKDLVFTIDPVGCEDKDDAISISKDYNKNTNSTEYILKVHIADVAELISDELYNEAKERVTTKYYPHHNYYMLPKNLSVDYLSLVHGKERLSITTTMVFNNYGKLIRSYIDKTKINCDFNTTYQGIHELFNEFNKEDKNTDCNTDCNTDVNTDGDKSKGYVKKYFELYDKKLIENKNSVKKIEQLKKKLRICQEFMNIRKKNNQPPLIYSERPKFDYEENYFKVDTTKDDLGINLIPHNRIIDNDEIFWHRFIEETALLNNHVIGTLFGSYNDSNETSDIFVANKKMRLSYPKTLYRYGGYKLYDNNDESGVSESISVIKNIFEKNNVNIDDVSKIDLNKLSTLETVKQDYKNMFGKFLYDILETNLLSDLVKKDIILTLYRVINRSVYKYTNQHDLVSSDYYLHFTSPIRRFVDLYNHKLLFHIFRYVWSINDETYDGYEINSLDNIFTQNFSKYMLSDSELEHINITSCLSKFIQNNLNTMCNIIYNIQNNIQIKELVENFRLNPNILEQKNVRGIILIPCIIQNELNLNTIGRFSNNFFKFSYLF